MKKNLLVILVALLLAGCMPKAEDCMAIEFSGNSQNINFGAIVNNQTTRTVSFWGYIDTAKTEQYFVYHTGNGWGFGAKGSDLFFLQGFSESPGNWYVEGALITGQWAHFAIIYDASSADNDPVFYVNGVAQAITTDANGSGTMGDDSDGNLFIGGVDVSGTVTTDGKIQDARVYNRILSESEILELHNSRCQRSVMDGLIFWLPLDGAAGLSKFDGVTLGTTNTVVDWISGAVGVPNGNPIGRGNTQQRIY